MIEQIKENPVKSVISLITLISMLVGGVLSVDSRYAKAADLQNQQQSIEHAVKQNKIEFNYSIDQLRKQSVEDKIFEIELIPENKRTQADKARLEKFKRETITIDNKWRDKDKIQ